MLLALAAALVAASAARGAHHVDLDVYVRAGRRWLAGADPYAPRPELPFTYPPFAVLLSVPMALAPGVALAVLSILTLTAAAGAAVSSTRDAGRPEGPGHDPTRHDPTRHDPTRHDPVALAPFRQDATRAGLVRVLVWVVVAAGAVLSEPVRRSLHLGQVNGLVVGLVLVDLLLVPRRWRGWLTGLAAGVKLTPLVFVLHPLARRDWATAARIGAGFAGTVALGAVALPAESRTYWTSLVADPGRVGAPGFIDNQSLLGLLTRLVPDHAVGVWLVASALMMGTGLVALQRRRSRAPIEGIVICGLIGLLASPISWSHHWLLLPAAVVVCARDRRPGAATVAAGLLLAAPLALQGTLGHGVSGALATSPVTLAGLLCLATLARAPGGLPSAKGSPIRRFDQCTQVRGVPRGYDASRRQDTMTKHTSNLQEDGTVFPPVTPDPPRPPGQPEIVVPELVPPKDTATAAGPTDDPKPTEQPD